MFNSAFLLATNIIDIIIDNIMTKDFITLLIMFLIISLAVFIPIIVVHNINEKKYAELSQTVLSELGFQNWDIIPFQDLCISTKTRLLFDKYTTENFFDYELDKLEFAIQAINKKVELSNLIKNFIQNNKYQSHPQYKRLLKQLNTVLFNASHFRVYVSHTGVSRADTKSKVISITQNRIIQEKLYRELECVALKE